MRTISNIYNRNATLSACRQLEKEESETKMIGGAAGHSMGVPSCDRPDAQ